MKNNYKTAVIFGGTGFIGRQVVREMAKLGWRIKVATRIPESAYFLRPCGVVGQIVPFACDYSAESIAKAVEGCDYVVNCIGILFERRKGDFHRAHVEIPARIAESCADKAAARFVHISALGIEDSKSRYAATKREGEKAVQEAFPAATILKPSIVFGEDDTFFNMFAGMAQILPFLPLIGGGRTKFQPVFVGDVADAAIKSLTVPKSLAFSPLGQRFALGGPDILTFKEVYETLFHYTGLRRPLVELPWGVAKIQATFLGLLPKPLLTRDQVESLKTDSIVQDGMLTLADLGIMPTEMDIILPHYLERYRPGGRFAKTKSA